MKKYIAITLITSLFLAGCSAGVGKNIGSQNLNKPSVNTSSVNKSNDPCDDKVLNQLEQKDSLTIDEMKIYVELIKLCNDSQNTDRRLDQTEKSTDAYSAYLYLSVIAGIASLIWLFTL